MLKMSQSSSMWGGLLHAGISTFLKASICSQSADDIRGSGAKAVVFGFPYDGTCISRTGTNYGPRALRDASSQFIPYQPFYNVDIMERYHLVDCGDVNVVLGNAKKSLERGTELVEKILAAGSIPVMLGGEHLISVSGTTAMSKTVKGSIGMVVFDCHLDTATDVGGELLSHCCPWTRTLELQNFDGHNIALIGIGALNPKEERAVADKYGISIFTIDDIVEKGIDQVTKDAIKVAKRGTKATYVSVDIDSIDAAFAPGTGVPTPGGLTSREIIRAIKLVGEAGFDAFDLVEVSPPYDHDGITAVLGCRIILDALAANAKNLK